MNNEVLLVVEDNAALREGVKEILTYEGFVVLTASNGREALEQMNNFTVDLILSDISMPEMDGFTFCSQVRARQEWVAIPFIFLTVHAEKEEILAGKHLGVEDYLIKPVSREELVIAVRGKLHRSRQIAEAQRQQAMLDSLTVLANAIDQRDSHTHKHIQRVTEYALALAVALGWKEQDLDHLRFGAILHDIGKILIPDSILLKVSALTPDEWVIIRRHPVIGAEMLKDIPYLAPAIPVVRYHHERWDGSGYPDGLVGEAIPPGARLLAIADSFDAMTSQRPYSPAKTMEEAYQEILRCSGRQFDPQGVRVFQSAWNAYQIQKIARRWGVSSRPA